MSPRDEIVRFRLPDFSCRSIPGVDSLVEQFGAENPADFIKNFPHPKSTIVDLNDLPFVRSKCFPTQLHISSVLVNSLTLSLSLPLFNALQQVVQLYYVVSAASDRRFKSYNMLTLWRYSFLPQDCCLPRRLFLLLRHSVQKFRR